MTERANERVETIEVAEREAGMRLDRWFRVHFPEITHSYLQKLLRSGQVRVDGKSLSGHGASTAAAAANCRHLARQSGQKDGYRDRITMKSRQGGRDRRGHQAQHLRTVAQGNLPPRLAQRAQSASFLTRSLWAVARRRLRPARENR